eukprot:scaffold19849_cov53-Cyclotella_meneghiniana.AAC.1
MGAVGDITETGAVETEAVGLVAVDNDNTDDLIIEEFIEESPPDVTGLVKMHHGMYVKNDDGRMGINDVIVEAVGTILLNNPTYAEEITNVFKKMKDESKSQIRNDWLPKLCRVTSDVAYLLGGPGGYFPTTVFANSASIRKLKNTKHATRIFEEDEGRNIRQGFLDILRIMVVLRYLLRNDYDGLNNDKSCTLFKDVIFDEESKTLCKDHNLLFNKDELNLQRYIRLAEEWIQEHGVLIMSKSMSKSLYAVLNIFDKQPQPLKDAMLELGFDNTRKQKDQNQDMVDQWEEYLKHGEQFDDYFHEVDALSKMMPVSKMIPPEPHLDDENYDSAIALHRFAKHALSATCPLTKLACWVRKVPERVSRVLSIQPKTRVIEYGVAEKAYIRAILKAFRSTRNILEENGCQITILANKCMKTNSRRPDLQIIAECAVRVASLDTDDAVEEESHNEYYTIYVDVEIDERSHRRYAIKDEQIRFSNVHFGAVEEFEAMSRTTIHCDVGELKQANPDQVDTI